MACTDYCLSPRQRAMLVHRCDVWREDVPIINSRPQAPVYTLVASGVPCRWSFTPNVDEPLVTGRDNSSNFFTRDLITFPYTAPVGNANWLVDRTTLPGGRRAASYGKISRVQGAPEYFHPSHRDRFGRFTVNGMVDENPPPIIVDAAKVGGI